MSEKTDSLLRKFLLENELVTEEEIEQGFSKREEAEQFGGSITLLEILFHMEVLSRIEIEKLYQEIPDAFPKLTSKLPPENFTDVIEIDDFEEKAIQNDFIEERYTPVIEKLKNHYESIGLPRSKGEILLEMRLIDDRDLKQISPEREMSTFAPSNRNSEDQNSSISLDLSPNTASGQKYDLETSQSRSWNMLPIISFAFIGISSLLLYTWLVGWKQKQKYKRKSQTEAETASKKSKSAKRPENSKSSSRKNAENENKQNQSGKTSVEPSHFSFKKHIQFPDTINHPIGISASLYHIEAPNPILTVEEKTDQKGVRTLEFGPFRTYSDFSEIPPALYFIQNRFKETPAYLPPAIRYKAESHFSSDKILEILESSTWTYPILIHYGKISDVRSFLKGWLSFLRQHTRSIQSLYKKWQKSKQKLSSSGGASLIASYEELVRSTIQGRQEFITRFEKLHDRFVISPLPNLHHRPKLLYRVLYVNIIRRLKSYVRNNNLRMPDFMKAPRHNITVEQTNQQNTENVSFKKKLKNYQEWIQMSPEQIIRIQLRRFMNQESKYLLRVKGIIDAFRETSSFRRKVFTKNGETVPQRFVDVWRFIKSFLLLREPLFSHPSISQYMSKNHYRQLYSLLRAYSRATMKKLIQMYVDDSGKILKRIFSSSDEFSPPESLEKKLKNVRRKIF